LYHAVPENVNTPPTEGNWNFLGEGGWGFFSKTKAFKEINQA